MDEERYVRCGAKRLRRGYTTGTCAALAAAGAAELLLTGRAPEKLSLLTPGGLRVELRPEGLTMDGESAVCAVRKDAGDDPDVTDGILITARVSRRERGIKLEAGEGSGRVTKPGLDQKVGEAAINSVPREMIRAALETVCDEAGFGGGLSVTLSVPGGAELAKKTFNPQLGIEGGISILGTSGIVEPMSERALLDTIALEIRQAAASGSDALVLTPGNYGMDFLREKLPALKGIPAAKCSNFIGDAVDIAVTEGLRDVLLVGHVGKLVKLAGGIMNTHSKTADCRRELFVCHAALCGAGRETCRELMEQVSADGCLAVLEKACLREAVMESLLPEIQAHLDRRAGGALRIGAILFSNVYGLLGETAGVKELGFWRREKT